MQGPWKRFAVYAGDETIHQVGRLRDTSRPAHGGNVETLDTIFPNAQAAEEFAAELNMKDGAAAV